MELASSACRICTLGGVDRLAKLFEYVETPVIPKIDRWHSDWASRGRAGCRIVNTSGRRGLHRYRNADP